MTKGIPYFPLDCQLDDKFALIEAEFGLTGFAVVVKLFQKIYGQQGYYCEYNNEVALLFGRSIGLGGNAVSEIVAAAIRRGIFDQRLYDKYHILTSEGIQERYFEAVSRRKKVEVKIQYLLVECANLSNVVCISEENADISSKNADISKQRKGKKSKVKESKEKCASAEPTPSVCDNNPKHKYGEYHHVLLSDEEHKKLIEEYGDKTTSDFVKALDEYLENRRDKHYSNHYLTIRNWIRKAGKASKKELPSVNAPSYDLDQIFEYSLQNDPSIRKRGE